MSIRRKLPTPERDNSAIGFNSIYCTESTGTDDTPNMLGVQIRQMQLQTAEGWQPKEMELHELQSEVFNNKLRPHMEMFGGILYAMTHKKHVKTEPVEKANRPTKDSSKRMAGLHHHVHSLWKLPGDATDAEKKLILTHAAAFLKLMGEKGEEFTTAMTDVFQRYVSTQDKWKTAKPEHPFQMMHEQLLTSEELVAKYPDLRESYMNASNYIEKLRQKKKRKATTAKDAMHRQHSDIAKAAVAEALRGHRGPHHKAKGRGRSHSRG
jgi:hypothetical protein